MYPVQQGYPPQPAQGGFQAPQGYPPQPAQGGFQAPQGYPPQPVQGGFAPQQNFPPAQAQAPLPAGSLEAFRAQPRTDRPAAISWRDAPLGTTYVGTVIADCTDNDVIVDTDPTTKAPKTWRDGSPRFVLVVALQFPDGNQASLYCRGQLWDAMSSAMSAAGRSGTPKSGDVVQITLTERRQGRGAIPRNIFTVAYATAQGDAPPVQSDPAPVQSAPVQVQSAPAPVQAAPAPVQSAPVQAAPAPVQAAQAPVQAAPAPQGNLPAMSPEQQALLAKLGGVQA